MKYLFIAPHPDDEVLGCGGTIAKLASIGKHITICYITRAYSPDWSEDYLIQKEKEIELSKNILGINDLIRLDYPTVKLDLISQKELNDSLIKIINVVQPDCTFIPHNGDLNLDHRIVHEACLVALRPLTYKCKKILAYETLSETEWGSSIKIFNPSYYIDISNTIEKKIEAMRAFLSEMKNYPHPRSDKVIRALAMKRGSEILVEAAEAFMPIRIVDEFP